MDAIDLLESQYFKKPDRTHEEIQSILLALSTHGNISSGPTRDRIVSSYVKLLGLRPEFAPALAADLTKWQRPDLVFPIATLLKTSPETYTFPATIELRNYIRSFNATTQSAPSSQPRSTALLILLAGLILLPILLKLAGARHKASRRHPH